MFLEAAERGDKHTIERCLQPPRSVNVNCTDLLGRSALQIAVDNENNELVEILLQQPDIKIGDALLHAITEGVLRIVELLIDHPSISSSMLASGWSRSRPSTEESSDFSPDISPVILAAHCNQFEILQLFLARGAYIDKPHPLSCFCRQCEEGKQSDSLRYSLKRIHTYRALASPAWLSLTSHDPILSSFKLSWELERLAKVENEFKDTYMELSTQCKRYSCELLDQCRSSEEVIAVLNRRTTTPEEPSMYDEAPTLERLSLDRLKLALKYDQKQFVAHPHCQQLLTSIWYEGFPIWRRRGGLEKVLLCLAIITAMPLLAATYLLFPRTRLGRLIRSPFMKFIYHSASFGCFLVLLVLASTRTEGSEVYRQNTRGPAPSVIEWLILFWVSGMVWSECKQLWEEGLKAYVRQWWNWLDFIMLSLYLCTFSLRAVAYLQITTNKELPRTQWPNNDPTLIAEGVFAVANVFSFARIIYLFQTNPHLGPLQISLGCMIIDIAKFLFIFFLVLTSFACGLNQLYWYYDSNTEHCTERPNGKMECQSNSDAFTTLDVTFATLFWSLFGISSPKSTELVDAHPFVEFVGQGLFMAYHVLSIIVLINMLIAMMSNSFQVIEDHADQEWKFARSKLWMSYFDEGCTLPPPFNVIISPKSVFYFFKGIKGLLVRLYSRPKSPLHSIPRPATAEKGLLVDGDTNSTGRQTSVESSQGPPMPQPCPYNEIMRRLVNRYIHKMKKQCRQDGVNEDDLLEIKQDISSLRYELREDRKRESARTSAHLDTIKKDIVRSVRSSLPASPQTLPPPQQRSFDLGMLRAHHPVVDLQVPPPPPQPLLPHSLHGSMASAGLYGSTASTAPLRETAPETLEALKRDIIASVRAELRDALREMAMQAAPAAPSMQSPAMPPPVIRPPVPPPPPNDLYQTHLYTQL
ncbi:transient-receptor-potential-like protein [Neocloeon triangulifer]|uniref:transient-receptor-potential-like protein n=1 Tax=Neocloeon triangulifer TaxID=2078957 RepID=UPI00286F7738|nr:transient-receptor-potential-like protein [Neocloeon triangulifer]